MLEVEDGKAKLDGDGPPIVIVTVIVIVIGIVIVIMNMKGCVAGSGRWQGKTGWRWSPNISTLAEL